jgi:hypothetical protein
VCMKNLHMKSPCCHAPAVRFGGRRRQCTRCFKTWRIRKKHRGRKGKRLSLSLGETLLVRKQTIKQHTIYARCSERSLAYRSTNTLKFLLRTLPPPLLPRGKLILLGDGVWFRFQGKRHILYVMAVRSLRGTRAVFLDPVLIEGNETYQGWRKAIEYRIHPRTRKRIVALVSDGFSGYRKICTEYGWVPQRCHFHLIAMLQRFRGRHSPHITGKSIREEIYHLTCKAIRLQDESEVARVVQRLRTLSSDSSCPKWMKLRTGGFLRAIDDFRAYVRCPEFNLPTTTNSVENTAGSVREMIRRARGFKTAQSLLLWSTSLLRLRKSVQCKGANYQPN